MAGKRQPGRDEANEACLGVLEVLRPALRLAVIDVYSDFDETMPPHVTEAARQLRQHAGEQRDRGMGVEVEVDDDNWQAISAYAPWSINVELYGEHGSHLGTLHDCGYTITADLTEAEANSLQERLAHISELISLRDLQERRRQARRDKWRSRLAPFVGRRHPDV